MASTPSGGRGTPVRLAKVGYSPGLAGDRDASAEAGWWPALQDAWTPADLAELIVEDLARLRVRRVDAVRRGVGRRHECDVTLAGDIADPPHACIRGT